MFENVIIMLKIVANISATLYIIDSASRSRKEYYEVATKYDGYEARSRELISVLYNILCLWNILCIVLIF